MPREKGSFENDWMLFTKSNPAIADSSRAVETIFSDRAFSCIAVHDFRGGQLRRNFPTGHFRTFSDAVEMIFSGGAFWGISGIDPRTTYSVEKEPPLLYTPRRCAPRAPPAQRHHSNPHPLAANADSRANFSF